MMLTRNIAVAAALVAACVIAPVASAQSVVADQPQLDGLTADEADSIIARLEDSQRALREGERQSFTLLSGSVAYYDQTLIPPRDAFLAVPFEEVWQIKQIEGEGTPVETYRLSYAPHGLGQLFWDIEVAFGANGNLEQVTLTYKPPAPF